MRYLLFLLWIPAVMLFYLSIHQEVLAENARDIDKKPGITAHAGHAH